ncbi:MAG: 2-phospho-L-lactate transferase [Rhodospirillales bacterium]|nr:2-phospho-L-lactate transferase [Rhodospirillales bacterium]
MSTRSTKSRFVVLSGGVGGAKLALGLSKVVPARDLLIVANTGDDFTHLGLHVSPDIDTLIYTLGGVSNPATGWGRVGETGAFMEALGAIGGETWFFLGDKDLALHVERTLRLTNGESLSAVTADLARRFGVKAAIVPMSNDPVPTMVKTTRGTLAFQHYFVRERCRPRVTGFRFQNVARAKPEPRFMQALNDPKLAAVIIGPSNPFISIEPILALPRVRKRLDRVPVIAVSPIVGGQAIKGPAAKMMRELGIRASALAVAERYASFCDGFVIDEADVALAGPIAKLGLRVLIERTVMKTLDDRVRLGRAVVAFAKRLSRKGRP